jgi:hypothetical protein
MLWQVCEGPDGECSPATGLSAGRDQMPLQHFAKTLRHLLIGSVAGFLREVPKRYIQRKHLAESLMDRIATEVERAAAM